MQSSTPHRLGDGAFRALVEGGSEVFVLLDADGVMIYASPNVQQLLGYHADELIGQDGLKFLHPEDVKLAARTAVTLLRQPNSPLTIELRARRQDSSWCELESVAVNRLQDESLHAIVVVLHEITQRKQRERSLRDSLLAKLLQQQKRIAALTGIVPICMYCNRVQAAPGEWQQLESFIEEHFEAFFSHGVCPDCIPRFRGEAAQTIAEPQATGDSAGKGS